MRQNIDKASSHSHAIGINDGGGFRPVRRCVGQFANGHHAVGPDTDVAFVRLLAGAVVDQAIANENVVGRGDWFVWATTAKQPVSQRARRRNKGFSWNFVCATFRKT